MESVVVETVRRLRAAGCVFAEDEAAMLIEAVGEPAGKGTEDRLWELVRRRADGEPLEQVVGYADFCGIRVRLRPGVFVPRVRSEFLVRIAAAKAHGKETVVDLCCGSGALGLAFVHLVPGADLYAADSDPAAVACAKDNIGGQVFAGDLFDALPGHLRGQVDILLANVPYVATRHIPFLPAEARLHEPQTALDGGDDGLDVFRAVLDGAGAWLRPGGLLLSEITEAQIDVAMGLVRAAGLYPEVHHEDDLEATVVTAHRLNR
ncbi:putative protein N(5)-glutamine methyltransferase [Actinoplanes sp. NPDC051494]|uniref:putative protein N(5)-glutamine methyltransferase n=1 Tax=Actinoplanes sp. NPDC051494 TaxID=3363907 RepID=UPI0037B47D27